MGTDVAASLKFDYEILQLNEHVETQLRKDKNFIEHLGLILNTLILEAVEYREKQVKNEHRTSDTEKSN